MIWIYIRLEELSLPRLGVYDGLDPSNMCDVGQSYHNVFDINEANSHFVPFELGGDSDEVVTVARIAAWPSGEFEDWTQEDYLEFIKMVEGLDCH